MEGHTPMDVFTDLALVLPTISFCGAVKWWKWCRVKPRGRNCWLPWNC